MVGAALGTFRQRGGGGGRLPSGWHQHCHLRAPFAVGDGDGYILSSFFVCLFYLKPIMENEFKVYWENFIHCPEETLHLCEILSFLPKSHSKYM